MRRCFCFWSFIEITWLSFAVQNGNTQEMATNNSVGENTNLNMTDNGIEMSLPEVRSKRQIDDFEDEFKPKRSEEANIQAEAFYQPASNMSDNAIIKLPLKMKNYLNSGWDTIKNPKTEILPKNEIPPNTTDDERVTSEFADIEDTEQTLAPQYSKHVSPKIVQDYSMPQSKLDKDVDKEETGVKEERVEPGFNSRYPYKDESYRKNKQKKINKNQFKLNSNKLHAKERMKWDGMSRIHNHNEGGSSEPNKSRSVVEISQVHSVLLTDRGTVFDQVVKGVVVNVMDNNAAEDKNKTVKVFNRRE